MFVSSTQRQEVLQSREREIDTHPPLKAPTGFLTGATTASCLNTALVWNPRVAAMFALTPARAAVRSSCDTIVSFTISLQLCCIVVSEVQREGRVVVVVVCLTCDRRDVCELFSARQSSSTLDPCSRLC
jgi:hypothetical protein